MKQPVDSSVAVRAEGLTKCFGSRPALSGVSFEWRKGETLGLLGSNGAGKTTMIKLITGLLAPDRGRLLSAIDPHHRNLGVAPQEIALYSALSVEENLAFFGRLYGLRGRGLGRRVDDVIGALELAACRNSRLESLSGGWQRRVNLAAALVHQPEVLLLDEPTAGLDVEVRFLVWQYLRQLGQGATSILVTSHQLEEVEQLCDRVAILSCGRLTAFGSPRELCALVPAAEIATVESSEPASLAQRARHLGLAVRDYGGRTALLLPNKTSVSTLAESLQDPGLRSLTLEPVRLVHAYLELSRDAGEEGRDCR